jgi:hypothetical protein
MSEQTKFRIFVAASVATIMAAIAVVIAIYGGLGYVIVHFIHKYW